MSKTTKTYVALFAVMVVITAFIGLGAISTKTASKPQTKSIGY